MRKGDISILILERVIKWPVEILEHL
jgi:hypothetical protein